MKLAFLFPGQGMQEATLPETWRRSSHEWRCLERVLGSELLRAVERGGAALERTDVLQPTLVAHCLAVTARLQDAGVSADVVAGHSVGEIAALAAVARLAPEVAIGLAAVRGRLMAREAARHPGGMLALLDGDGAQVAAALALGEPHGVIALAAVNSPDQRVLSGEMAALDAVASHFASRRLAVAGAWHSPLMAGAVAELRQELEAITMGSLSASFVLNRTGRPLAADDDLPCALAEQLVRPVQWVASLQMLEALDVTDVVTVGPGRVLRGLIRKNSGTRLRVHTTDDDADLARTIHRLKGAPHGQEVSL